MKTLRRYGGRRAEIILRIAHGPSVDMRHFAASGKFTFPPDALDGPLRQKLDFSFRAGHVRISAVYKINVDDSLKLVEGVMYIIPLLYA